MSDSSAPSSAAPGPTEHQALGDADLQAVHAQLLREKSEPSEGFAPMPLFLVFIFAALSFWAGIYLIKYSGGFDPFIYNERDVPGQMLAGGAAAPFDPMVAGEKFFKRNCIACHQVTGLGVPGAFPPLVQSDWVKGSEERLIKILLHGMTGPVTVKGVAYNGAMPAFGTSKDRDLAAVLTWIRGNEAFGNQAPPVAEEKVAEIRQNFTRTTPWSGPELEQLYGAPVN